jgi:inosine/xanthosine triphosphate pyrophosphatase family protein
MTLTKLNFITGNKNKLLEVRAILGNVIEVDNQEVDVPEIQGTIEEIAKEKARRAAEAVCSCFTFEWGKLNRVMKHLLMRLHRSMVLL